MEKHRANLMVEAKSFRVVKVFLLKVWRELPIMIQVLISRLIRPRFRVAVAAIILDEQNRILLCEHSYRKFHPWGLPGGGLEPGESPECGVQREVWEETGLQVQVERLLSAESATEFRHISLIYLCKITGGGFQPNLEIVQTQFFNMEALPNLLSTERALIERVAIQLSL